MILVRQKMTWCCFIIKSIKATRGTLMEKYEQYKMLYYLSNALQNRCFFKEHLEDIYEWHDDYGKNIVDYTWTPIAETKRFTDFKDIVRTQKAKAYKRGEEFVQELEKKIKSLKNSSLSIMEKRIRFVSELLGLSECEQELYGLLSRIKLDDNFEDFNRDVCGRNNKLKYNASFLLATKQHKIEKLLEKDASLIRLGLVENDYGDVCASDLTLKILSQHIENVTDIKNIILGNPCKANLQWNDFSYLKEKDFCARILQKSVKNKEKGINLLFYGEPGTGKTEFAKILAEKIKAELYAVGEKFEDRDRKENLNLAYSILSKDNCACLLIDEADDFLGQEYFGFIKKKDDNKLYINRLLENNQTPAIWIINSIENIDKAYLRRFTYALNFSKPNLKIRTEMWQKSLKAHNLPSDKKTAEEFAVQYKLSPSFITTAVRTAQLANGGLAEVKQSLNALEKAYNNGRCIAPKRNASTKFNPKLLNTDTDLTLLSERIKQLPQHNFSLCLYGASGTGKSAFGEYLGNELAMPIIKKKCSDLLSMWVGGTEQNVAAAFEEGKENQAVLIFDEADSFLQDRSNAVRSWEVTQVNEMLTQMESYPYPFICTTNLMDSLDKASLRRFTFKVAYDYMTPEQSSLAFKHFFNHSDIDLSHLNSLAPGDFVVVKQKAEILGFMNNKEELIRMLEQEQQNKAPIQRKIGFL